MLEHEIIWPEQRRIPTSSSASVLPSTRRSMALILRLPRIDKGSVRKGDTLAIIEQRQDRHDHCLPQSG